MRVIVIETQDRSCAVLSLVLRSNMASLIRRNQLHAARALRRERIFRDRSNPIDMFDDFGLLARFRMDKAEILLITDLCKDVLNTTRRNRALLPVIQVCIALRFFATGTFLSVGGDLVGVSKSTACRAVRAVASALTAVLCQFVKMPSREDIARIRQGFYRL